MERDTRQPTTAQIETVYDLIRETRGDVDWYAPEKMTRGQAARLIEKLQDEKRRADDGHKRTD